MGVSTDGLLFLGWDLGEVTLPWDDDGDLAAWWRAKGGDGEPPVEDVTHCSLDYPMKAIAIRGRSFVANRGCPQAIDTTKFGVSAEEFSRAKAFMDTYVVPFVREEVGDEDYSPGECQWWLASLWG